jgi:hypothetical protein
VALWLRLVPGPSLRSRRSGNACGRCCGGFLVIAPAVRVLMVSAYRAAMQAFTYLWWPGLRNGTRK